MSGKPNRKNRLFEDSSDEDDVHKSRMMSCRNLTRRIDRHASRRPVSVRWLPDQDMTRGAWRKWVAVGAFRVGLHKLLRRWCDGHKRLCISAKRSSKGKIFWRVLIEFGPFPPAVIDLAKRSVEIERREQYNRYEAVFLNHKIPDDIIDRARTLVAPLAADPVILAHLQTARRKVPRFDPKPYLLFLLSCHNFKHIGRCGRNRIARAQRRLSVSNRRLLPPILATLVIAYFV